MRLEVTRRADLAVRVIGLLADGEQIKGSDLAAGLGASPGFMAQVVGPLVKTGWVRSEPGPTGGYVLDRAASSISVLDVVEAVDGPTDSGRCVVADRRCGRGPECALHVAWTRARAELMESLRNIPACDAAAAP